MRTFARETFLRTGEAFDDDPVDDGSATESTLPGGYGGLMVGLAMISMVSWICTAALVEVADLRVVVLLLAAVLLVLLIVPSAVRCNAAPFEIPWAAAALQYGAFAALSLLGWSTLLWAPGLTWAAMAAAGVLQTGYTLGVGLVGFQTHLTGVAAD